MSSPTTSCVLVSCTSSLFLEGLFPSPLSLVWVSELCPIQRLSILVCAAITSLSSAFTYITSGRLTFPRAVGYRRRHTTTKSEPPHSPPCASSAQ
eukprot:1535178-Pyramimonas_sp.AAC.1